MVPYTYMDFIEHYCICICVVVGSSSGHNGFLYWYTIFHNLCFKCVWFCDVFISGDWNIPRNIARFRGSLFTLCDSSTLIRRTCLKFKINAWIFLAPFGEGQFLHNVNYILCMNKPLGNVSGQGLIVNNVVVSFKWKCPGQVQSENQRPGRGRISVHFGKMLGLV